MALVGRLSSILAQRRYLITAAFVFVAFLSVYLASTQFLIWAPRAAGSDQVLVVEIADHWRSLLARQRAPFLFEPIGTISLGRLTLFVSLPNLILGSLLGALVASNLAVSYYRFRSLSLRGAQGISTLLGTLPALLSGAVCCVPTLILVVGLQLTATFIAVWSFFVPVSFVLLVVSLWWSLRHL